MEDPTGITGPLGEREERFSSKATIDVTSFLITTYY
jgi:hypothetical protein